MNISKIKKIVSEIKIITLIEDWPKVDRDLLLLENGVYDRVNKTLKGFDKTLYIKERIPHSINLKEEVKPLEKIEIINTYLDKISNGIEDIKKLLVYFIYVIIYKDVEHQKYLELIGPGGTGKSTFINMIISIIGEKNVSVTEFKRMELNRFETFSFLNKKLICVMDSSKYKGDLATLKSLLGGDLIRMEEKGKQQITKPLKINVIIASNEAIRSNDLTSGIYRRRVTIPFINRLPKDVTYININEEGVSGVLVKELPEFIKYIITLNKEEVINFIKSIGENREYKRISSNILTSTNPLVSFILDTFVFINAPIIEMPIKNNTIPELSIYSLYLRYSKEEKIEAIPYNRLINLLEDILTNILGMGVQGGVESRKGVKGLAIKVQYMGEVFVLIRYEKDPEYAYEVGVIPKEKLENPILKIEDIKLKGYKLLINRSNDIKILLNIEKEGEIIEIKKHTINSIGELGEFIYNIMEKDKGKENRKND